MKRDWPILIGLLALGAAACGPPDGDADARRVVTPASAAQTDYAGNSTTRRVWARAENYATPSSDGRFVTYVDWSTGDVAMHDLETGDDLRLTDKGDWFENWSWAEEPLFSPDGTRVAFAYGNAKYSPDEPGRWRYELQMVEVGDTRQQLIYALEPEDLWLGPFDWSETHGIVAEVNRADETVEFSLIDPATGSVQVLEVIPVGAEHPHEAYFSPDDRYLADRRGKEIHLRDLTRGATAVLDIPVNRLLGWIPDGSGLLIHTDRDAETGIWALPVDGLQTSGDPALLLPGLPGVLPSGLAGERAFYVLVVDTPKLYSAAVDAAAARVLAEPVPLTSIVDGRASHPRWSPDGTSLAYTLADPLEQGTRIMLKETDGDAVREVARVDYQFNAIGDLIWTADGKSLAFLAIDGKNFVLVQVDIQAGTEARISETKWLGRDHALLPDGETVLRVRHPDQGEGDLRALVAHSMADGSERVVAGLPLGRGASGVVVAPDGAHAATRFVDIEGSDTTGITLVSLADGMLRDLYAVEAPLLVEPFGRMAWTPDGNYLVIAQSDAESGRGGEFVSVSVETGAATPLLRVPEEIRSLDFHPDGRRLSFVAGVQREELWVIDDISSIVATARDSATR